MSFKTMQRQGFFMGRASARPVAGATDPVSDALAKEIGAQGASVADASAVGPDEGEERSALHLGEGRQDGGFCTRDRRGAGWVHDPQALQLRDEVAGGIAPMP